MSFEMNDNYISTDVFAADAPVSERATFITRTYLHLLGAIAAFVGIEALLLKSGIALPLIGIMAGSPMSWLVVLGLFVGVSWIADMWAHSATSKAMQYMGLALYVVAEAVVFLPMLYIAANFYPQAIPMAAGSTAALVVLLTAVVFITRKDFSFLRPIVLFGGLAVLLLIVGAFAARCAEIFGVDRRDRLGRAVGGTAVSAVIIIRVVVIVAVVGGRVIIVEIAGLSGRRAHALSLFARVLGVTVIALGLRFVLSLFGDNIA